jgi:hypothetical protein
MANLAQNAKQMHNIHGQSSQLLKGHSTTISAATMPTMNELSKAKSRAESREIGRKEDL